MQEIEGRRREKVAREEGSHYFGEVTGAVVLVVICEMSVKVGLGVGGRREALRSRKGVESRLGARLDVKVALQSSYEVKRAAGLFCGKVFSEAFQRPIRFHK